MMKRLVFATVIAAALLAACGGGGDDDGGNGAAAGTSAMAAAFETELTKTKECVQGEIDGKGACAINFLQDPVTRFCSDVRTGKVNPQFPDADLTKFTATCDDWKNVLAIGPAEKVTTLDKMLTAVAPLK